MLAAAREVKDEAVYEHVGGAGIERMDLFRLCRRRNDGNVGDAAEVERDAAQFLVSIEKIVGVRYERRALAAKRDVRGTKIADSGDSRGGGNDGWLADLKRRSGWRTEIRERTALMEDSLAMAADERNG